MSEAKSWAAAVGPVDTVEQFANRLDVGTEEVAALADRRQLVELVTGDGCRLYPMWQAQGGVLVPGLAQVLAELAPPLVDNWTLAAWCRIPHPELNDQSVSQVLAHEAAAAMTTGAALPPLDEVLDGRLMRLVRRTGARWRQ